MADATTPWEVTHDDAKSGPTFTDPFVPPSKYHSLITTVRLYAAWLFAWYMIVFILGSYQATKNIPFGFSFIEGLYASFLVQSFAVATFLFLLCTSIIRTLKPDLSVKILISLATIAAFWFVVSSA